MRKITQVVIIVMFCVIIGIFSIGMGSVSIAPRDCLNSILDRLFGVSPFGAIDPMHTSIMWSIRIPRALLAFVSGAGLSMSDVMMQSVLRNPLASSLTLGVSAGASLGAGIAILFGVSVFGFLTLPIFGLTAGLITVFLSLGLASKIDHTLQNNSIILVGMAFSLFANAMLAIIMGLAKEQLERLVFWQMGSFAMKTPQHFLLLLPVVGASAIIAMRYGREMDIMTLGDEQAQTSGVEARKMKWKLLSLSAVMTGTVVSMVGVIGFVGLFTPHIARKLFGASHNYVVPVSALLGGAFVMLCDLIARTAVSPRELPVGAITAAVGAPFFIYLYFSKRAV